MKVCKKCGKIFFPDWGRPQFYCPNCRKQTTFKNLEIIIDKLKSIFSKK